MVLLLAFTNVYIENAKKFVNDCIQNVASAKSKFTPIALITLQRGLSREFAFNQKLA